MKSMCAGIVLLVAVSSTNFCHDPSEPLRLSFNPVVNLNVTKQTAFRLVAVGQGTAGSLLMYAGLKHLSTLNEPDKSKLWTILACTAITSGGFALLAHAYENIHTINTQEAAPN